MLSITGATAAIISAPVLLQVSTNAAMSPFARYSLIGGVLFLGLGTTSTLNWFVSPYVTKMKSEKNESGQQLLELSKITLFGNERNVKVDLSDLKQAESMRPMVSWQHRKTGELFFVHDEVMVDTPEASKLLNLIK